MSRPPRTVREATDNPNEYEVVMDDVDADDEDAEAMFAFSSDEEAEEYIRGHQAIVEELSRKKEREAQMTGADNRAAAAAATGTVAAPAAAAAASSSSSSAAAPQIGGMVTVVQVSIQPAPLPSPSSDLVRVHFDVFQRYVPHLNAHKGSGLTSSDMLEQAFGRGGNNKAATNTRMADSSDDSSDDDDDSDEESVSGDLVLTGDLEKDQRTLAKLMDGPGGIKKSTATIEEISSSSDDEDDEEDLQRRAAAAKLIDMDEDEDPDVGVGGAGGGGVYTKNELKPDQIPPPSEFEVAAEEPIFVVGKVSSVVDRVMVVESSHHNIGQKTLDIGSAICSSDRKPLGRIEEVMGLVSEPFYAIRLCASVDVTSFPDPDDESLPATLVYSVPGLSSFATPDARPGTDASNMHDEEVGEDEQEFSDDEKETEAKQAKKQALRKEKQEKKMKEQAEAVASGKVLPGAVQQKPARQPFKAKRNQRNSGQGLASPSQPTAPAAASAAAPAPALLPQPTAPAANHNAPLLPMPGTVPQQPFYQQPFSMQQGAFTPGAAAQQQQQQAGYGYYPQQAYGYPQQAYAGYYPPQQAGGVYGYAQPNGYPQPAAAAVPGGWAGWGPQNLAGAQPAQAQQQQQQQAMYAQYGAYGQQAYAQPQPNAATAAAWAAANAAPAQPGATPPQ